MVEDIFALTMRLHIGRHRGEQLAVRIGDRNRCRFPSGAGADRARVFHRGKEFVGDKGIVIPAQRVPFVPVKAADRGRKADDQFIIAVSVTHTSPGPSAISASAWLSA